MSASAPGRHVLQVAEPPPPAGNGAGGSGRAVDRFLALGARETATHHSSVGGGCRLTASASSSVIAASSES